MQLRPAREVSWPPTKSLRRRRRVRLALLVSLPLLLTLAGYVLWWMSAAAAFRDGTLAWIEQRRADGWQLSYGDVSRIGFPFRLGVRLDDPVLGDPEGPDWALEAARVKVTTPLTGERRLRVAFGGDLSVTVPGPDDDRRWRGRARQLSFDVVPAAGWMPNGRFALRELLLHPQNGDDDIAVTRMDIVSTGDPAAATGPDSSSWSVALTGSDFRLPKVLTQTCGREVNSIGVDARLTGRLEPTPWPAALLRWRDDGGVVDVEHASATCGALVVDGEGTLALDERGQPIGAMSTRIQGYEATLDRLAAAGAVEPHTAAAAKILLRALARSSADGAATLKAPITLQDRSLSIGPVPLLTLPQIDWPADTPAG